MALWQYDINLAPRSRALQFVPSIPGPMELGEFDSVNWWSGQDFDYVYGLFDGILPRHDPPDAAHSRSWGSYEGDSIRLGRENTEPEDIYCRIDLRDLNHAMLGALIRIARDHDLVVYLGDQEKFIAPSLPDLLAAIYASRKLVFVNDPEKFFADKKYLRAINQRVKEQIESGLPDTDGPKSDMKKKLP